MYNICHRHGLGDRESLRRAGLLHGRNFGLAGLGRALQQAPKRQNPHGSGKKQEFDSE